MKGSKWASKCKCRVTRTKREKSKDVKDAASASPRDKLKWLPTKQLESRGHTEKEKAESNVKLERSNSSEEHKSWKDQ